MIIVTVKFVPSKKHEGDFLRAFNTLAEATRNEDGCISYDIYPSNGDASDYFLFERWESKPKLDVHLKTTHFVEFMNVSKDWYEEEIDISVYEASKI